MKAQTRTLIDITLPDEEPGSLTRVLQSIKDYPFCPFCKIHNPVETILDQLSLKEFTISGLCQRCQDLVFSESSE